MIYTENANFPYPLFTNDTVDYKNPLFDFDVNLSENKDDYIFEIDYTIGSQFIKEKIACGKAKVLFIVKSKDNKFFELTNNEKEKIISKSRLSLSARTELQLMIQAEEDIGYEENYDLIDFYDQFKKEINVGKGNILGFSNVVFYDGSDRKPFDIFEKRIDETIKSDIKITIEEDVIIITYKNEIIQFASHPSSRNLNNLYLYMGLQKALMMFIMEHSNDGNDGIILDYLSDPREYSPLFNKLISLMRSKGITECNLSNLDEVICKISDDIIRKFVETIGGMSNED